MVAGTLWGEILSEGVFLIPMLVRVHKVFVKHKNIENFLTNFS